MPNDDAQGGLRALVAKWEDAADWEYNHGDRGFASGLDQCANELRAELAAVVSLPANVSVVRCEHGGVQVEGHTLASDWELELDTEGNVMGSDGICR